MAASKYDILHPTCGDFVCVCGSRAWPGEIVWSERKDSAPGWRLHCLGCAQRAGAPPVPVDIVAQSARITRDHFAHAMAGALTAQPAHPTHFTFD